MTTAEPAHKHCPSCGESYPPDYAVCPRDATPLQRADGGNDPLLGTVLGESYEIERVLGEGGMGRVYRARHVRLGRPVAVKVMHRIFAADRDALARFRREAVAAASISSPHVAQVVDVNATREGQPFLVCELLDGEDLGAVLEREGALTVPRAVSIARQVARGLQAAHAAGVVHRDLKPENVMLVRGAAGGEVAKVLDFGIAKSANDGHHTRTGTVLGTPAYMAPEQARGGTIDHRCDIYALGAMLYRSLTGRPAFSGEDPARTLTSVIHDEPERPRTLRKDLPDALELLVQRAMAKDPNARFSSMAEIDEALAPFEEGPSLPVNARAMPLPADAGRADTVAVQSGSTMRARIDSVNNATATALARAARPRMVAWGLGALAWCLILVGTLLGRAVSTVTGHALQPIERVLVLALAAVITAPLAVLEVRRLVRGAWRNTATMLTRADTIGRAALLSLAAYAAVAAPGRMWTLIGHGAPSPGAVEWAALAVGLAVGAFVLLRPRR